MNTKNEPVCPVCGGQIPPKKLTGPRKTYCSRRCQDAKRRTPEYRAKVNAAERAKSKAEREAAGKKCAQCGADFVPQKSLAKIYCSKKCLKKATKYSKSRTCSVDGCSDPVANRGMCNAHYRREDRAEGREKRKPWDDKTKKNYQIRIQRLGGARNGDPVMLDALIRRGDRICPECGEEIDLDLKYPHAKYRTIDHVVPLAKGGKHELSNCQLMHYQCNAAKGVRLSAKA